MDEITQILEALKEGDTQAHGKLLPIAYNELRRIAAQKMASERDGHTLQPTALVHEAYMRLLNPDGSERHWDNRAHFFVAASEAMRRILVESMRRKMSLKRGGNPVRETWDEAEFVTAVPSDQIIAVHEALGQLEQEHPDFARVAVMRYFAGMTITETATALGVSPSTVEQRWRGARAWLRREILDPS